jgi:hypothetical protein
VAPLLEPFDPSLLVFHFLFNLAEMKLGKFDVRSVRHYPSGLLPERGADRAFNLIARTARCDGDECDPATGGAGRSRSAADSNFPFVI